MNLKINFEFLLGGILLIVAGELICYDRIILALIHVILGDYFLLRWKLAKN